MYTNRIYYNKKKTMTNDEFSLADFIIVTTAVSDWTCYNYNCYNEHGSVKVVDYN